ncbi:MAG: hypothetical protein ACUVSW_15220, partial [Roseiflexus sp.]
YYTNCNARVRGAVDLDGDPATMTAIRRLLQHTELPAYLIESIDGVIRRIETIVENVGALFRMSQQAHPASAKVC